MKKRIFALALIGIAIAGTIWGQLTYHVPERLILTSSQATAGQDITSPCVYFPKTSGYINRDDGQLNVLVWNIYKQNRDNALPLLAELSHSRQLFLLQEAKVDGALERGFFATLNQPFYQVDAWEYHSEKNGVLTGSAISPTGICGFRQTEPWLRLPKSSLLTYYLLSNGELLAVANIHAINFTFGLDDYREQINQLVNKLKYHSGPVIFAGDFNSWSEERTLFLNEVKKQLNLQEVQYKHDSLRTRFWSEFPLDHVFYRGLKELSADVIRTDASDHNPIMVKFKIIEPQ